MRRAPCGSNPQPSVPDSVRNASGSGPGLRAASEFSGVTHRRGPIRADAVCVQSRDGHESDTCFFPNRDSVYRKSADRSVTGIGMDNSGHGMLIVDHERKSSPLSFVELVHSKLPHGVSPLVFLEGTTSWGRTGRSRRGIRSRGEKRATLPLFLDSTSLNGHASSDGSDRHVLSHNHYSQLIYYISAETNR